MHKNFNPSIKSILCTSIPLLYDKVCRLKWAHALFVFEKTLYNYPTWILDISTQTWKWTQTQIKLHFENKID